jgi:hypothetical protein
MSTLDSNRRVFLSKKCEAALKNLLTTQWRELLDYLAFNYNDLPVEEETPNTLQYEGRDDQSRADNDKQQTENLR